ncbi:MAG: hypothetical protein IT384_29725 [Deltaproteobacteria bacterium]|nr:hypothetical protein [Deltaproteobacteria bacterium]
MGEHMSGNGKHTEFFIELSQAVGDMPAGYRGSREFSDIGLYELHEEVPIDGIGVPFDDLLVVERTPDGRERRPRIESTSRQAATRPGASSAIATR